MAGRMGGLLGATLLVLGLALQSATAQPAPVFKDAERFAEPAYGATGRRALGGDVGAYEGLPSVRIGALRPARRVMGDATYSGSEYGLGKPSYNGIGTRPDWGRGNP
jgi:hypothetical protein